MDDVDRRCYSWTWPNLLSGGRGTQPSRGKSRRTRRRTQRRARQLTSQAGRAASRYVVFRPSLHSTTRASARGRAQPRARPRRGDRRRRDGRARHDPAADDRPTRRPRTDRSGRARRRAVHREPARCVRRTGRSALARGSSRSSGPPARHRCSCSPSVASRADDDRGVDRLLAQPVAQRPVLPAAVGDDVSGPDPRSGRRASWARAGPPRPRSRRSPAASSPTGSVARRLSRWRVSSASSAPSPTPAFAHPTPSVPPSFSARDSFRALRDRPVLSRIAVAQGFYGGGLIAAAPLYAIVNVDRLNLSLSDVGIIGILTAAATTLSLPAVGRRRRPARSAGRDAHRQRPRAGRAHRLRPGAARRASCGSRAVAAGAGSASIDVGIASAVSDHTPLASRAAAMAGWNAITGARGIVAAFTMSILLQLGIVDVTTGPAAVRRRHRRSGSCSMPGRARPSRGLGAEASRVTARSSAAAPP